MDVMKPYELLFHIDKLVAEEARPEFNKQLMESLKRMYLQGYHDALTSSHIEISSQLSNISSQGAGSYEEH